MTTVLTVETSAGPERGSAWRLSSIRLTEAIYLLAVAQTLLLNPVLARFGTLSVYASSITWLIVGVVALMHWTATRDEVLLAANRRLVVVTWVAVTAVAVQILLLGMQVYTVGSLMRLLYAPLGILAAFAVYRRIEAILDVTVGLVGLECLLLILPRVRGPLDLSNRLSPASLGGRNAFGALLMVLIVLRISLWAHTRDRPPWYVLTGLAAALVAMVMTLARSPVLGLVAGLLTLALSALRRRGITGRSLRSAAIVGALLSPLLSRGAARERLTSLSLENSSGRSDIWEAALDMFRRRPVFGHGFGSFNATSPHIIEDFVTANESGSFDPLVGQPTSSAHNVILQVLAEGGILGLAIVGWCLYYLLHGCWHRVLLPVMAAIFVDSLFDTFAYVIQMSWILGLVFATGLKLRSADDDSAAATA